MLSYGIFRSVAVPMVKYKCKVYMAVSMCENGQSVHDVQNYIKHPKYSICRI